MIVYDVRGFKPSKVTVPFSSDTAVCTSVKSLSFVAVNVAPGKPLPLVSTFLSEYVASVIVASAVAPDGVR